MFECEECGATAATVEEHACPAARSGSPRMRAMGTNVELTAPPPAPKPSILDLLTIDEEKLDRVIDKLDRLQGMVNDGALERLERLASLTDRLSL